MPYMSLSTEANILGIDKEPCLVTISKNEPVPRFKITIFAVALFVSNMTSCIFLSEPPENNSFISSSVNNGFPFSIARL